MNEIYKIQIISQLLNFLLWFFNVATAKENNIIDRARHWDIISLNEALHINEKNSTLTNNGLKTSKARN